MPDPARKNPSASFVVFCVCLLQAALLHAQGTRADYERANGLEARTRNQVFKAKVNPHWFAGGTRFWYRNDLPGRRTEYILVDAEAGRRAPAFDAARLAETLGAATGERFSADHLPIEALRFADDGSSLDFTHGGKRWRVELGDYQLHEQGADAAASAPDTSEFLKSAPRPHASRRTGEETTLTLLNRTPGEVNIEWLDPEGKPQPYGTISAGGTAVEHTYGGHVWLITSHDGKRLGVYEATDDPATALIDEASASAPSPRDPARRETPSLHTGVESPDHHWFAFVRERNVFLFDVETKQEFALTQDGERDDAYGGDLHWSPDSQKLGALRTKAGDDRKVYLVESSPKDRVQPRLLSYDYLKPGDQVPVSKPHLFHVADRREIPVPDTLFPNPWDLGNVRWDPDSRRFTFDYNQRGHQVLRVMGVDAETGQATAIIDEQSATFIDYSGKHFEQVVDGTGEIIWMSERDGWNHLYLYDAHTGVVKNQITRGPWVVRGVDKVDEAARQIWFHAGGIRPEQNPYYVHFCRVNFDGTGLVILTAGDGDHSLAYSPDRRFFVDTWSRVDQPPVNELRRTEDGALVCELEHADASGLLKTLGHFPERFVAKGRDGTTDIHGVIFRPTGYEPARKYPVVENIYAGPQDSFTPKKFQPYYGSQKLAELGFIVVQMDGMGTSNRSKAFHDVCWKNLGDAGFPDRILWMQAAAKHDPAMDLSRVGIYGGSAGGQNALGALLFHGEFYKAAVADCGCHDNRMDKIWWNEQWMGWPVGPEYAAASNVDHAKNLRGNLLLVVGELDHNVDPASTMQVVNALIKADKDFDLLVVPGADHGAGGSPYGERRREDFFVRHLLGAEPRAN